MTLYWKTPDENGGEITKYTIYMKNIRENKQQASWIKVNEVTDTSSLRYEYMVESLVPGHNYTYIVTAWNKYGESDAGGSNAIHIAIPNIKTTACTMTTTATSTGMSNTVIPQKVIEPSGVLGHDLIIVLCFYSQTNNLFFNEYIYINTFVFQPIEL